MAAAPAIEIDLRWIKNDQRDPSPSRQIRGAWWRLRARIRVRILLIGVLSDLDHLIDYSP